MFCPVSNSPSPIQPIQPKPKNKPIDIARIAVVGPLVTFFAHPFDTFGHRFVKNACAAETEKMPIFENPFAGAKYLIALRTVSRTLVFGVQSAVQPFIKDVGSSYIQDGPTLNFTSQIVSGFIAGATEALLHPFNLLVTKVQVSPTRIHITKGMATEFFSKGAPWKGVQYTALRDSISAATIFACIHYFNALIPENQKDDFWSIGVSGLIAGATAGTITAYPATVINQIACNNTTSIKWPALFRAFPCRAFSLGLVVAGMKTGTRAMQELE